MPPWLKSQPCIPLPPHIHSCVLSSGCAGLADRLRGSMFLLRVAARTKRVFLFYHVAPEPLEVLLAPNHIDWTVNMTLHPDIMKHYWREPCCDRQSESSELMASLYNSTEKYVDGFKHQGHILNG